jgi:hypothetical protein
MIAGQVLNHVLPALAGVKPNVSVTVEHYETSDSGLGEQSAVA